VRSDTANRAFLALAALALMAYVVAGMGACVLFALVAYHLALDGVDALAQTPGLSFALVFLALTGAGAVRGFWSFRNQLNATEALTDSVRRRRRRAPDGLVATAARVGLRRLDVVDAPEVCSFTYGLLAPRVATTRGLLEALSASEVEAVLAHERYHVRSLDPLKVLLARTLPAAFFYLPLLQEFRRRYVAARELAADRQALEACGPTALAGALYKTVRAPAWADLRTAAAIGGAELLDLRVAQLETGQEPSLGPVPGTTLVLSAVGAGLLLASLGFALAGREGSWVPMPHAMATPAIGIAGSIACASLWVWVGWRIARRIWRWAMVPLDTQDS
jgi:Zn-dependent protease with chaperone function